MERELEARRVILKINCYRDHCMKTFVRLLMGSFLALIGAVVFGQETRSCASAVLPEVSRLPQKTVDFYGDCAGGRATNGLVVSKQRGVAFALGCVEDGKWVGAKQVMNSEFIGQSSSLCIKYVSALPGGCSKSGYRGQCNAAGEPEGVGYLYESSSSSTGGSIRDHALYSGMFKAGKMDGAGLRFMIKQCGYLGCTGGESFEYAYFVAGSLEFECEGGLSGCLEKKQWLENQRVAAEARRRQEAQKYESELAATNPQAMYLAAGIYARNGDLSKAEALYNRIISRFASSTWAVKASDQLDAQKRGNDAAQRQSDDTSQRQQERDTERRAQSSACSSRIFSCERSCEPIKDSSSRIACKDRCQSICSR